jgi:hypothetical protein
MKNPFQKLAANVKSWSPAQWVAAACFVAGACVLGFGAIIPVALHGAAALYASLGPLALSGALGVFGGVVKTRDNEIKAAAPSAATVASSAAVAPPSAAAGHGFRAKALAMTFRKSQLGSAGAKTNSAATPKATNTLTATL